MKMTDSFWLSVIFLLVFAKLLLGWRLYHALPFDTSNSTKSKFYRMQGGEKYKKAVV